MNTQTLDDMVCTNLTCPGPSCGSSCHGLSEEFPPSATTEQTGEDRQRLAVSKRAKAIAHGDLLDITAVAREVGFKIPVAVSRAVWDRHVTLSPGADEVGEVDDDRLWNVVWMLGWAAVRNPKASEILFDLDEVPAATGATPARLKAVCAVGDRGEPVLTVFLPEEASHV